MMKQAFGLWKAAQREASMSVYTRCGGLDFGSSDSKAMGSLMESVRENHVEHEVLSPSLVRKRHPMLKLPSDYIAIANKDAGVLNATKSVAMFLQLCRSRGADIRDRSPVETISTTDGPGSPVRIMLADGSTVECAKLVLTAGPWAGKMLKRISIAGDRPLVTAPPLQPIHCTVAFWKAKYPELFQPGRFPIWIHYDDDEWNTFYGFPILEMPGCLKIDLHGGPPCDPDNRHFGPGAPPFPPKVTSERYGALQSLCTCRDG